MKCREFFEGVAQALKKHDPAVQARFDVGGDFYRNREEASPAFSYALKGNFRADRRRIFAALACFLALCALLHRKRK